MTFDGTGWNAPPPAPVQRVCPYCLSTLDWSDFGAIPLVKETAEGAEVLMRAPGESEDRWRYRTMSAMRQCAGDGHPHTLPPDYGDFEPLIIGLIGNSAAGKTHLLTAMIEQLRRRRAVFEDLRIEALDGKLERNFYYDRIQPFLEEHRVLDGTRPTQRPEFAYALRVHSEYTGRTHAVGFFDVAGEHFRDRDYERTPFMSVADAVIYVADAAKLRSGDRWARHVPDPGFTHAIAQLRGAARDRRKLPPAVIVVAKSDLLAPVHRAAGHWLAQRDENSLADLRSAKRESRDAYRFLSDHGAELWLEPWGQAETTIHFASASGVDRVRGEDKGRFPEEDFGPRRVLRPLMSLFSMTGLVPRVEMDEPRGY
ncbi:TRAFAC clade GTPase domain-containing protein [Actinomadura flavalba]|uniref:TRAFAC clade GTPase domain-containing protein n=1 Tax=Actinomadura flavalba TaxID=1120938 RepID=UPI0003998E3D|nr:hypothetical protein [Actinomadura flavalba]